MSVGLHKSTMLLKISSKYLHVYYYLLLASYYLATMTYNQVATLITDQSPSGLILWKKISLNLNTL